MLGKKDPFPFVVPLFTWGGGGKDKIYIPTYIPKIENSITVEKRKLRFPQPILINNVKYRAVKFIEKFGLE